MGIELKPCPFCGSDAAFKVGYHMTVDVKVGCDECGAEGPVFGTDAHSGDFRPQAADAWNRRTDEEITRLRAELAAKSKEVQELHSGIAKALDEIEDAGPKALKYAEQELRTAMGDGDE